MSSSKIKMNTDSINGLHLRPIAELVQITGRYKAEISIEYNNNLANGKSILDILMLGISPGEAFTILAQGDDAEPALEAIRGFFMGIEGTESMILNCQA